jgi:hypothetical protein
MTEAQLRELLEAVRSGALEVDQALDRLRHLPFEDLGFAKVDHHRALRHGMPEVIFALGKTSEEVVAIAGRLLERSPNVLITRADPTAARVRELCAEAEYFPRSGAVRIWRDRTLTRQGQDRGGFGRHQRLAGSRGGHRHGGSDGQCGGRHSRRGRRRHPSAESATGSGWRGHA